MAEGIEIPLDVLGEGFGDYEGVDEDTPLIGDGGEDETSFGGDSGGAIAPNIDPTWSDTGVPAGLGREDLAGFQETETRVGEWRANLGLREEVGPKPEFVASNKGELWVRWGGRWLLLTYANRPREFLAASTLLRRYGADVAKFLGVHGRSKLSTAAAARIADTERELGSTAVAIVTATPEELSGVADRTAEAVDRLRGSFSTPDGADEMQLLPLRELQGLDLALRRTRGELENNIGKLGELDRHISREEAKLKEAAGSPKLLDQIA